MSVENRYSTVVAWIKVALPLIALALLSTLFLFSRTPDPDAAIPFADVDVTELAREQRLSNPRFAGTLEDGREVLLMADAAMPVQGVPDQLNADNIEARIVLSDVDFMLLDARHSLIDLGASLATLTQDVHLTSSTGYRLDSNMMTVALNRLDVYSPGPVSVTGPAVTLTAGTMRLTGPDGAQVLRFTGGVRVLYDPPS
jgi:lipopolysaccharide export system protein LptC